MILRASGIYQCRQCATIRARKRYQFKFKENLSKFKEELAKPSHLKPLDAAWIAGLFEGEGTITISTGGRSGYTRPVICLTSTDLQMIDILNKIWPGYIRTFVPNTKSKNAKTAQTWVLNSGLKCFQFARDVLPYIRTERVRKKFEILIEYMQDAHPYNRDPDRKIRQQGRLQQMRELNRRGIL